MSNEIRPYSLIRNDAVCLYRIVGPIRLVISMVSKIGGHSPSTTLRTGKRDRKLSVFVNVTSFIFLHSYTILGLT